MDYALTSVPPPYPDIFPLAAMARNGADFPALSGHVTIPAGANRADILERYPISPQARAFYFRRQYHGIIPLPVAPPAAAPAVWTVEASADLVTWKEIGTTDPSGENGDFVDVNAGAFPVRFYRFRPLS